MEAKLKKRRGIGLSALFWRYLITTGLCLLAIPLVMFSVILGLMYSGLMLPANTAAIQVQNAVSALPEGSLAPSELPYYVRWAVFDTEGHITEQSPDLSFHRQAMLQQVFHGGNTVCSSFPYTQYHQRASLPDGRLCIMQYDFSVPYCSKALQGRLPDAQFTSLLLMLLEAVVVAALLTRHYTHILKRDAKALTAATQTIAAQQLDVAFSDTARVRELQETLSAMDALRQGLADSLQEQWALEEQRRQEVAALAHDLKTPLAIISGNGELLAEDSLLAEQQQCVDAILRSAERMKCYVGQLRTLAVEEGGRRESRVSYTLTELFDEWAAIGRTLCDMHNICFSAPIPQDIPCCVLRESLTRAVQNLLDNAARFTPVGGKISLMAYRDSDMLCICVRDSGPGFTPEALSRAGHAFYTQDTSRPADGHMGLGLYAARQVAERHAGKLLLQNESDGAAVTLQIRLFPAQSS